jgi:glycosyltransferase involved in cell wall biosynthesis
MIKLLIISHALVLEPNRARWRALAQTGRYDIRLLVPESWVSGWFDTEEPQVFRPQRIQREHYEVCPVPTTNNRIWGRYLIKNLHTQLRDFSPDVIYCIHEESIRALHQAIIYRRIFAPRAKLVYFSMDVFPRVPKMTFSRKGMRRWLYRAALWRNVCWGTDGAICHYPGIRDQMRREGYKKPILIQTQIGVDPDLFKPDSAVRERVRRDLGLDGFVIGFVGRLTEAKGVLNLLTALDDMPPDWQLLLVGDGDAHASVEAWIERHNYGDRVKMTGYVPQDEVPEYMNAMDSLVLGSHTTETWIDTFPLVVPQAMAIKIPVIGSDSGAIPYQLGGEGLIFPEKDVNQLRKHLYTLADHPDLRRKMGEKLYDRAQEMFCIEGLNRQFSEFLEERILA